MAWSIGWWIRDTALVENQRNVDYSRACLDSMIIANSRLDTTIPGQNDYKRNSIFDKIKETKSNHEQYPWLFKG